AEAKKIADRNGMELVLDYYRSSRISSGHASRVPGGDPNPCFQPWKTFYVKSNGEVKPCCFTGRTMGNLKEATPEEIWNGVEYRRLRDSIARGVYPEGCGTCVKFNLRPQADDSDSWLSVIEEKHDLLRRKSPSVPTARPEEGQLVSGEEQFSRGDVSSAMKTFLRVLEIDRTNPRALNNLGVIQWHAGDAASAMETFQVALSFHPDYPDALTNLLKAAAETGRLDLLHPELLKVLEEAQPENPDLAEMVSRALGKDFLLKPGISVRTEGRVHIDSDWQPVGVGTQFLENAETYHARYYDNKYWKSVVGRALDLSGVDRKTSLRVLDIGSGSGNTVFAAAELLPDSVIFANDISPQLLQILVRVQEHVPGLDGRIEAYCFDLHKDFFADDRFDLVLGGAILHHMLDPIAVLENAARWLRPGGSILLVEPLEAGGHMMTAVYLTLISELEADADPALLKFFKAICEDFEARFGIPRVKPWTRNLDDKWFFHESFLRQMAGSAGLTLESVSPTGKNLQNVFRDAVYGHIRAAGLQDLPIPEKMPEILKRFDTEISEELKKRFVLEGIIVLSKPRKIGRYAARPRSTGVERGNRP
ncbi:MAG: methyltransferase domain-containing protein, partial [Deltaproteobacteria bacterium]|nr:methyltransferase domain-containing protein [Deltaproteobacteria bacterium]